MGFFLGVGYDEDVTDGGEEMIDVVAAAIRREDKVLATKRAGWQDGGWEFPGGKIEYGETPEDALIREIREELNADIRVGALLDTVEYQYPGKEIRLSCYRAELTGAAVALLEHEAAVWVAADEIDTVGWLPADRQLLPAVKRWLSGE